MLNTFASQRKAGNQDPNDSLYDTVAPDYTDDMKISLNSIILDPKFDKTTILNGNWTKNPSECLYEMVESPRLSPTIAEKPVKTRQPIYATPNIPSKSPNDGKDTSKPVNDGNYVPSGDLYRTTARYIEDINKNIAEIDRSYEELGYNPRNPGYGVITKIQKSQTLDQEDSKIYSYRKNMAPMPPISPDFLEKDEDDKTSPLGLPKNCRRPNSYGKLPPKLLPRSTSIENTSSRLSTSSTGTSSTKSSESLYAISESLNELPRSRSNDYSTLRRANRRNVIEDSSALRRIDQRSPAVSGSNDPGIESDDELRHGRPRVTGTLRRSCSRVEEMRKGPASSSGIRNHGRVGDGADDNQRRYDTLPGRRVGAHPLHKSSEDVLEGERPILQRGCASTIDVRSDLSQNYLVDATEVIMQGQIERRNGNEDFSRKFSTLSRVRQESVEVNEEFKGFNGNSGNVGAFATLPRRGSAGKEQRSSDAHSRRLSGNAPVLEPLYEHAVSDPVRPRDSVIPWWELATKKYRHRSCPALQVTY